MNKREKKEFVLALVHTIVDNTLQDIDTGLIPDNWDGIELRWLLADKFSNEARFPLIGRKRKKDYKNTVLVNDL